MKRRSENGQLRKEEYDMARTGGETPSGPFERASAEELTIRKRVRISDDVSSVEPTVDNKKNPFASVTFASSNTLTPTASSFPFSTTLSTKKLTTDTMATPTVSILKTPSHSGGGGGKVLPEEKKRLTVSEFKELVRLKIKENPNVDLLHDFNEFITKSGPLQPSNRNESPITIVDEPANKMISQTSSLPTTTTMINNATNTSSLHTKTSTFTFGISTNNTSSNNNNYSTTGPSASSSFTSLFPTGGASTFHSSSNATNTASTSSLFSSTNETTINRPPFSFGSFPSSATQTPASSTSSFTTGLNFFSTTGTVHDQNKKNPRGDDEEEEDTGGGDEGEAQEPPTLIEREENTEDDILMECDAACRKRKEDGTWIKHGEGCLRLYRNKINPKQQKIVIRDNLGRVKFNVAVTEKMPFVKQVTEKKGNVKFKACEDAIKGLELFSISVYKSSIDNLYDTLTRMANQE